MDEALGIGLRLVGIFYLLAALFGLRAVAMDRVLSEALNALTLGAQAASPGERHRQHYLLASSIVTGWAAIALCAGLAAAAPLLALAWAGQIAFLLAAPRYVDPDDPPPPEARRTSWIACAAFGALAGLGGLAAWNGVLRPVAEQPWVAAVAGTAALLLTGYAAWLFAGMPGRRPRPAPTGDPNGTPLAQDEDLPAEPSAQILALESGTLRVVLTPSWNLGALREAATGAPLECGIQERLVSDDVSHLIENWLSLFREVADPTDPRRCRIRTPDGLARLEALGRPLQARLVAELGPDRVTFDPAPRPVGPEEEITGGLDVMSDYQCHPVWFDEPDRFGCVAPDALGISWSLARDLDSWAAERDGSFNLEDPGGPPLWSEAQEADFEERGRQLALRLVRELAATERAHIRVSVWTAGQRRPVSDAGPGLPGPASATG